jgi:fructose-specific phosphotransferase system IIA component
MHETGLMHSMTVLVIQLGIILFAARWGGILFQKLKLPSVLGEFLVGIIIGPYVLGAIPLPGFPHGLFPLVQETSLHVSYELYGFATVGSILLLFLTGLETDLNLLLRFSFSGILVGLGGIILSFAGGAWVGMLLLGLPFGDPVCLLLGVIMSATSVGITARILSERKKMDSPEGVTIIAGAVIDDVLSIIILAIVIGISISFKKTGNTSLEWGMISMIAVKAFGIWLGFTALGLIFAGKISNFLKKFHNKKVFSVLALGLALLVAGVFEKSGLAMIIGAYIMGLSLSKTDLSFVIQGSLTSLQNFFIPIFFTIMGMLVNIQAFSSGRILMFGLIFSAFSILAKVIGSGGAALLSNFNSTGALRIGLGMVPRGEVALIIASMGLSYGIIDNELFGAVVMMPLITAIIGPFLFDRSLAIKKKGYKKTLKIQSTKRQEFKFPGSDITQFVKSKILLYFNQEGFFINQFPGRKIIFNIRKDDIFIVMTCESEKIILDSSKEDETFVKTLVYESLVELQTNVSKLQDVIKPEKMQKQLVTRDARSKINISKSLDKNCILMSIKSESKEAIINELIDLLVKEKKIKNKKKIVHAVMEREETMSTGMQHGLAFPHGKTEVIKEMHMAVGIHQKGVDFQSLDGEPCQIFILIISPLSYAGPHVQLLAGLSTLLKTASARKKLLQSKNKNEVWNFFGGH